MFVLINCNTGVLNDDSRVVGTYASLEEAHEAMVEEIDQVLYDDDPEDKSVSLLHGTAYLNRADAPEWHIFGLREPTPKRNPNVAETVSYECKNDPTFQSGDVLLHQATVRWNSGKSFEVHAPERVELRVGGTSYEYKAV